MTEREYRFVGGPWHGERRVTTGSWELLVPVSEPIKVTAEPFGDTTTYTGIKVAVYRLTGDYAAERFYRFDRMDRR